MTDHCKFVESISIIDVYLKSQSAKCFVIPKSVDAQKIQLKFAVNTSTQYDQEDKFLLVLVSLSAHGCHVETNDPVFEIEAEYGLLYEFKKYKAKLSDEVIERFATTSGILNAYPYLREAIQSISVKMGLPPIVPPLLKLPKKSEKAKSKKVASK